MIVTDVELWPMGSEERKRPLARVVIWNDGTGTHSTGNYEYAISHQADHYPDGLPHPHALVHRPEVAWKRGRFGGFKRKNGAVRLLAGILHQAFPRG